MDIRGVVVLKYSTTKYRGSLLRNVNKCGDNYFSDLWFLDQIHAELFEPFEILKDDQFKIDELNLIFDCNI